MVQLVLLRHGQSISNRNRCFTGWNDIALSSRGEREAENAGRLLKDGGYTFDICFTSVLRRANDTQRIVLSTMGLDEIPIRQSWRLNERHYGALEGINRWSAMWQFGVSPILGSQLRFNLSPPPLDPTDMRCPVNQTSYSGIGDGELPYAESMKQVLLRMLPYWKETIVPEIQRGKRVLIVSHKHILRSLMMQLDHLSSIQVVMLKIATGRPLVYELDDNLNSTGHYYADRPFTRG